MSTVRVNDEIKKEVMPILDELGISLSEAINMFLYQIKINNGMPFELKRKNKISNRYGSYVCEDGCIHDYSKYKLDGESDGKTYYNAKEMIDDILKEEE